MIKNEIENETKQLINNTVVNPSDNIISQNYPFDILNKNISKKSDIYENDKIKNENTELNLADPQNINLETKEKIWNRANNNPDSVIRGTEVRIHPFPHDITKEEIFDNFSVLGDIIDMRIIPIKNIKKNEKNSCECLIRFSDLDTTERVLQLNNAKFDVINFFIF